MSAGTLSARSMHPTLARILWCLLLIGALIAAGNALMFMLVDGHGGVEFKSRFLAAPLAGWAHTLGGAVAVVIGPFQLIRALRERYARVHVWLGRVYLIAVSCGALGGLYFAPTSVAGPPTVLGFTLLALFWLYTGTMAYITIRRRDVAAHRRWMLRNYALTFAAATLRVQLGLLILAGLSFLTAFTIVAWSSWVLNWLAVEWWLRRGRRAPRLAASAS